MLRPIPRWTNNPMEIPNRIPHDALSFVTEAKQRQPPTSKSLIVSCGLLPEKSISLFHWHFGKESLLQRTIQKRRLGKCLVHDGVSTTCNVGHSQFEYSAEFIGYTSTRRRLAIHPEPPNTKNIHFIPMKTKSPYLYIIGSLYTPEV